jgi:hypothetical protein
MAKVYILLGTESLAKAYTVLTEAMVVVYRPRVLARPRIFLCAHYVSRAVEGNGL